MAAPYTFTDLSKRTTPDKASAPHNGPLPNYVTRPTYSDSPGGRTDDQSLWDYYQGEKSGYTRNGVIQHSYDNKKDQ